MIRVLAMAVVIHYLWLSFGSSQIPSGLEDHALHFSWHHRRGGRVGSHGRSSREAVERRKQRLRKRVGRQWRVEILPRRCHHRWTAGQARKLLGDGCATHNHNHCWRTIGSVAQELLSGVVVDGEGVRFFVRLSCLVVPGLWRNLFLVERAARNGVVSIVNIEKSRLGANNFILLLQELGCDLYSFSPISPTRAALRSW